MPAPETKDTILDAAEALFAEQGFAATSLRQLTQRAGVNLASVNYHFGSKEALVKEVLRRRIEPINAERRRRLEALDAPSLEDVVRAFLEPALRAIGHRGGGMARVFGRVTAEQPAFLREFFFEHFGALAQRFIDAMRTAAPDLDARAAWLRMHFTVGAMAHTLQSSHMLTEISGGACELGDEAELVEQLVAYAVGGLRASARAGEEQQR
jgi:AcrR family transcriptional regulator